MGNSNVFEIIATAARKGDVRLLLIGGFAVNAYHYARNTKDIDFLTTDEGYRKLSETFSAAGYEESVRTDVFAKRVSKDSEAMPVDFLFVDPKTFEVIWRDSKDINILGQKLRIPSLMHLVALKLHAVKRGSKDRSWKDIPDILNLIVANGVDVGSSEFKEICLKYGPDGIYLELLKLNGEGQRGRS